MVSWREFSLPRSPLCTPFSSLLPDPWQPLLFLLPPRLAVSRMRRVGILPTQPFQTGFSLGNVHQSFLLVFSGLGSSLLFALNNVLLCACEWIFE